MDLKSGVIFVLDGQPWQVIESHFLRMQQRKPVNQTRIKNLISGKTVSRNFQPSENFIEGEISTEKIIFLYNHKDKFVFHKKEDKSQRFEISEEILADSKKFLKPNTEIEAIKFKRQIINIKLPIKMDLRVTEAPPGIKGDTAQGGIKTVTLETGAQINAPLFIKENDIIRINTETGEYVERVNK